MLCDDYGNYMAFSGWQHDIYYFTRGYDCEVKNFYILTWASGWRTPMKMPSLALAPQCEYFRFVSFFNVRLHRSMSLPGSGRPALRRGKWSCTTLSASPLTSRICDLDCEHRVDQFHSQDSILAVIATKGARVTSGGSLASISLALMQLRNVKQNRRGSELICTRSLLHETQQLYRGTYTKAEQ